jgi:Cysteine-rich secretory protein family
MTMKATMLIALLLVSVYCVTKSDAQCELTQWEAKMLKRHNDLRADTSPKAKDMNELYWDTALAKRAGEYVAQCDASFEHSPDSFRTGHIGAFSGVTENLHMCGGCPADSTITDGSGNSGYYGQSWWDESNGYNYADNSGRGGAGHYLTMASSNVYALGCASHRCDPPGPGDWQGIWYYQICWYGPKAVGASGARPFEEGSGGLVQPDASVFATQSTLCQTITVADGEDGESDEEESSSSSEQEEEESSSSSEQEESDSGNAATLSALSFLLLSVLLARLV